MGKSPKKCICFNSTKWNDDLQVQIFPPARRIHGQLITGLQDSFIHNFQFQWIKSTGHVMSSSPTTSRCVQLLCDPPKKSDMINDWELIFCTDKKLWPNYCLLEDEANKTNLLLMSILKLIYTPGQTYLQCKFYMFYSRTCWLLSVIRLTGLEVICIASLSVWASRKWPSYVSWQFLPFPFRPHFPWRKCNIQRRLFSCTFLLSDSPRYICICILLYFIQVWI